MTPQLSQILPWRRHTQVLPVVGKSKALSGFCSPGAWTLSLAYFGRVLYYGHYLLLIVQDRTQLGGRMN